MASQSMQYAAICLLFVAVANILCHAQDVQLYVMFCLLHILRLHAPESPFTEVQLQVNPAYRHHKPAYA